MLEQPNRKTFTGYRDFTMMMVLLETGMRISEEQSGEERSKLEHPERAEGMVTEE